MNPFIIKHPFRNLHSSRLGAVMLLVGSFVVLSFAEQATAGSWMYRRSYYSHTPDAATAPHAFATHAVPESRSVYRRPYVGIHPGFAVRGGYRINTQVLRSGNSTDVTVRHEGWVDQIAP